MSENSKQSNLKDPAQRPWWRRKRYIFLILVLLLASYGLVGRHIPKYLVSHADQDQCEFGTGSTALYERLRGEADTYLASHGEARFAGYSSLAGVDFSVAVFDQLRDFAMTRSTPTERWAAIHALLRAYGMEFDANWPRDPNDLESDSIDLGTRYIVLLPKMNWLCPLCYVFPEAAFSFSITHRGGGIYDQLGSAGSLRIRSLNIKWPPVYSTRRHQICPQVLK